MRNKCRMLDQLSVHIHYVQSAIRTDGGIHRPKPVFGRCHKFFFLCYPARGKSSSVDRQMICMDYIPLRVAEKIGVRIFFRENSAVVYAITAGDRKSTRLNSSHVAISYAVFCLKKKTEL